MTEYPDRRSAVLFAYRGYAVRWRDGSAGRMPARSSSASRCPARWKFRRPSFSQPKARRGAGKSYDGYVALGCVIRGETYHFEIVAGESARGLMDLGLHHGLCIGNGILTVENEEQALARAAQRRRRQGRRCRACMSGADQYAEQVRRAPMTAERTASTAPARARLAAVQAIYQMELTGIDAEELVEEFVEHRFGRDELRGLGEPDAEFFGDLVRGVPHHQVEIDRAIAKCLSSDWKLSRIDSILRAILRAASFELISRRDVPAKVVIDRICRYRACFLRRRRAFLRERRAGQARRVASAPSNSAKHRPMTNSSSERPSEFALIAELFAPLADAPGAFGLTDDAAIVAPPAGSRTCSHHRCARRGRAFPARRSAAAHREEGAAGEFVRPRGERG